MIIDDATKARIVAANSLSRHRDIKVNGYRLIVSHGAPQIAVGEVILVHIQLVMRRHRRGGKLGNAAVLKASWQKSPS